MKRERVEQFGRKKENELTLHDVIHQHRLDAQITAAQHKVGKEMSSDPNTPINV